MSSLQIVGYTRREEVITAQAMKKPEIYLASKSPRRKELLEKIGVIFSRIEISVDETVNTSLTPEQQALVNSQVKAAAGSAGLSSGIVIGGDTIVVINGDILGKPVDKADAKKMLTTLQANRHIVITALTLIDIERNIEVQAYDRSLVTFFPMSENEIDWYVDTGEPMDKAGAYGLQEKGMLFVQRIEGSATNVIGLPVQLLYQLFQKIDLDLRDYISDK